MLSMEYIDEALSYDPDTGVIIWKRRPLSHFNSDVAMRRFNTKHEGVVAGSKSQGYCKIRLNGKDYWAHRLSWILTYGEWPRHDIDHINHNRSDNRISNLREAPGPTNHRNRSTGKNNTSGFFGVYWCKQKKRWTAQIRANGKRIHLCRNKDLFEAICARKSAENKYGFHRNHGMQLTEVTT